MNFFRSFLMCLTVAAFTSVARADTFTSYLIQTTLADGGTLNAVLNFDSTHVFGTTLVGSYATTTITGSVNETQSVLQGGSTTGLLFALPQGGIYLFYPGVTTIVGFVDTVAPFTGTLCVQVPVSGCGSPSTGYYSSSIYSSATSSFDDFSTATVVTPLTAATPEPSNLALLGTGVLSLVGVMRRKLS